MLACVKRFGFPHIPNRAIGAMLAVPGSSAPISHKSAFWIHGRAFSPCACDSPAWPARPCGHSLIVAG
jgi:hypothetical protein